ncbi:isoform a [Lasius niger]|uniref:Isoform a n=1 Tax=Lasius niger TaxID=67767 RepID=A0A0J7KC28_LASNI|nr:isoform a [Lasius niger]
MKVKWDNELIIKLIEEHRKYKCLWAPSNKMYKCRKEDAWGEISKAVGTDMAETKRKMKNLISQFYRERKKMRQNATNEKTEIGTKLKCSCDYGDISMDKMKPQVDICRIILKHLATTSNKKLLVVAPVRTQL